MPPTPGTTTASIGWSTRDRCPARVPARRSIRPLPRRRGAAAAAAGPAFLARPLDRPPGAGLAGSIADESAAAALASRLAAIGMGDPRLGGPTRRRRRRRSRASREPRPPGPSSSRRPPTSIPPRRCGGWPRPRTTSSARASSASRAPAASSRGSSGWERRRLRREPRPVSSAGGGRGRGPEPSWEQPRKNEAYPTIRTRARIPRIPRVALGALALAATAAILFFVVPPLFVGDDSGGPGASGAASPGASSSARPSRTPARSAAPSPRVYVVRSGDTLSTIADQVQPDGRRAPRGQPRHQEPQPDRGRRPDHHPGRGDSDARGGGVARATNRRPRSRPEPAGCAAATGRRS